MQKITIVGRMGKYVDVKKVKLESGKETNQAIFTMYCHNRGETTQFKCVYRGMSDKVKESLLVSKGKNENGTTEYHSRLLAIDGTLSVTMREQECLVAGYEDEYEKVIAPSITIFVNSLEFLDGNPAKKEGTNATASKEDLEARREARRRRKNDIMDAAKEASGKEVASERELDSTERELNNDEPFNEEELSEEDKMLLGLA